MWHVLPKDLIYDVDAVSSPVQCIDHYLYFEKDKEYEEIICWNTTIPLVVNPSLPDGLFFINNTIIGKATSLSTLRMYSVVGEEEVGVFWLAGIISCNLFDCSYKLSIVCFSWLYRTCNS